MAIITVAGRRLRIHDRSEWVDPAHPVTGPKPSPELVHHAVIHWPGAADNWVPDNHVSAHLRWAHALYLLDPNKGFSYGYGYVLGPNSVDWGADVVETDIWEVRGTDIRLASNDGDNGEFGRYRNPNFNGRSNSLQIMCSTSHPASDDQILQARYWVAWMDQVYGETLTVIPHRTSDATSCPGEHLAHCIDGIAVRPTAPSPAPIPPVPVPPTVSEEADPMIPVIAKTTDGGHYAAFGGPGSPCYHIPSQISEAYVFGRGNGRALDLGSGRVVSWSVDSPGSWAAAKARLSKAEVFAIHPPIA